ncbi:MAG: ABC transporter permease [Desulfosporosinus sp. BRH_c37]|nr:MAG: ABC transporter permease [Desulfosporosinus sp. BRH_c37]
MEQIIIGTLEQGFMYAIMVLGVYLTFRVLDYADLTVDGSFTLGAAITATLITSGVNPWIATGMAVVGGSLAGVFTGILHAKFKITPLLSGILTMTALYSINLRVMGKANISLLRARTIFTDFANLPFMDKYSVLILTVIAVIVCCIFLYLFLRTEFGLAVRATGDNEEMIVSQGVNTQLVKIIGLSLSNGMVAFAGSFVAQNQQFADVGMGIGMIIVGLASVIIGEALIGNSSVGRTIIAVVFGAVVYRAVIALVLQLGLPPTDLKLVTAFIVIIALISPDLKQNLGRSGIWIKSRGKEG